MKAMLHEQEVLDSFSRALSYPDGPRPEIIEALEGVLEAEEARQQVTAFQQAAARLPLEALEEQYTRAFDLAPQAVPYLSVYLFGAESPQRGQFMAGLSGAYAQAGFDPAGELPDHLAVVLRYARVAPHEEWRELREWCLTAPVRHMRRALEKAGNPYQHLLAALETFLAQCSVGALSHA